MILVDRKIKKPYTKAINHTQSHIELHSGYPSAYDFRKSRRYLAQDPSMVTFNYEMASIPVYRDLATQLQHVKGVFKICSLGMPA